MKFLLNLSNIHVVVLYSKTRNFVANCFFLGNTKFDVFMNFFYTNFVIPKKVVSPKVLLENGWNSKQMITYGRRSCFSAGDDSARLP